MIGSPETGKNMKRKHRFFTGSCSFHGAAIFLWKTLLPFLGLLVFLPLWSFLLFFLSWDFGPSTGILQNFSELEMFLCSGYCALSLTNNFDCDISLIFSHWILNYNSVYSLILLFSSFNDEDTVVFVLFHTNSAFRFK